VDGVPCPSGIILQWPVMPSLVFVRMGDEGQYPRLFGAIAAFLLGLIERLVGGLDEVGL
jgi:hypothetical protein